MADRRRTGAQAPSRWHPLVKTSSARMSHLVPVVVPAVGPSDQNHPVLPTTLLLGGEGAQQPEAEPEQGEEERLRHVPQPGGGDLHGRRGETEDMK